MKVVDCWVLFLDYKVIEVLFLEEFGLILEVVYSESINVLGEYLV